MLSFGYRGAVAVRNSMFDAGWKTVQRAILPVVSVGNLTTGGTGKTPIVAFIVQSLQHHGQRPAMISRGYGSVDGQPNDEKLVLERLCPGVPHEQHASRYQAAQIVAAGNSVDVIVMDDGFQHRQLHRDLDIVLIDATNPFGYGHLLPRGLLREPVSALRRADIVMITRADMVPVEQLDEMKRQVCRASEKLTDRIYRVEFRATGLIDGAGQRFPLNQFTGQPIMLVSGIGNPNAFEATCRRSGILIAGTQCFPDHHLYSANDLQQINLQSRRCGASRVVTTLKDLVKLPNTSNFLALEIAACFPDQNQAESFQNELAVTTRGSSAAGR